jgi:hypothetical protein
MPYWYIYGIRVYIYGIFSVCKFSHMASGFPIQEGLYVSAFEETVPYVYLHEAGKQVL